jgi:hypothetical protein
LTGLMRMVRLADTLLLSLSGHSTPHTRLSGTTAKQGSYCIHTNKGTKGSLLLCIQCKLTDIHTYVL